MTNDSPNALTIALPTSTFLPGMGGVEVGLHNIAARLTERGHRPILIIPAPNVADLRGTGWQLPYEIVSFPPKIWGLLRLLAGAGVWRSSIAFLPTCRVAIDLIFGTARSVIPLVSHWFIFLSVEWRCRT